MRLLNMELRKIMGRPVLNIAFLLVLGFLVFAIFQNAFNQRTEIDGKVYYGLEAIQKDKEMARKYEGIWTMEKAEEIVKDYGFSGYNEEETWRSGNYCSQFVTDEMTDFRQTQELPKDFYQGQDFKNNVSYLVSGKVNFAYVVGWTGFLENLGPIDRMMCLYMILVIASVFSEEYSLKTANILLTTVRGKKNGIWAKIAASFLWCSMVYLVSLLAIFLPHIICYGIDGMNAGVEMMSMQVNGGSVLQLSVAFVLTILVGNLLNVCIMLLISSRCSQSVKSVIAGIAVFFMPYILWTAVINGVMSEFIQNTYAGMIIGRVLRVLCLSMPYNLGNLPAMNLPEYITAWIYVIMTVFAVGGIGLSYKSYRDYQALS